MGIKNIPAPREIPDESDRNTDSKASSAENTEIVATNENDNAPPHFFLY